MKDRPNEDRIASSAHHAAANRALLLGGLCLALAACGQDDEAAQAAWGELLTPETEALLAPACSSAKRDEVLAPATADRPNVNVACSLSLPAGAVVTKKIIMQGAAASGAEIACNGAVLNNGLTIRSQRKVDPATGAVSWARPTDITVQDCTIYGMVHVYGMAVNGQGPDLRDSSRRDGHTRRAQDNAPTRITLQQLHLIATGRIPLYVGPGVTRLSLLHSELSGKSESVALYLDAESGWNTIQGNYFRTKTLDELFYSREVLAVDGSAYNRIIGNRFSALDNGGIFIYRNCGEGGTIRHQAPVWNEIINNVFYYNLYDGALPAIWVASRNGNRSYCNDDAGYPFGSSANNNDLAQHTVIAQNRIYKFSPGKMIRLGNSLPQYVFRNETTTTSAFRPSGCFLSNQLRFLDDGEEATMFGYGGQSPTCTGKKALCADGELATVPTTCGPVSTQSFECSVTGNNNGCSKTVSCPAGQQVVSVKAACNLEFGSVAATDVASLPFNTLSVPTPSDRVSDGQCVIGGQSLRSGRARLIQGGTVGDTSFTARCREYDSNGGDCQVKGQVWCAGL